METVMDHICCFHFFPESCCGNHRCCCTWSVAIYAPSCLFSLSKLSLVRCTRIPPWMGLKNVFLMFGKWSRGCWEEMCEYNTEDLHMLYSIRAQGGHFRGLIFCSNSHFGPHALNFCVCGGACEFLHCLKANITGLKRCSFTFSGYSSFSWVTYDLL